MTKNAKQQMVAATSQCSRRDFLKLSGVTALGMGGMLILTGCGPAAPESDADKGSAEESDKKATLGDGKTLRVGMEAAYAPYNWQVTEESDFTIPIENVKGAYADGYDVQVAKTSPRSWALSRRRQT